MAATLAAIGSLVSAGAGVAGVLSSNTRSAQTSADYSYQALINAINQQQQQAQQNVIANQQARSGYTDSQGNALSYDPYTNSWNYTLGKLPQEEATAASIASIMRNTTDMRQAEAANVDATQRSLTASDAADRAMRAIQAYAPTTPEGLTGALMEKAFISNRETEDPLIADTLRQYARMGSSAGPVLAALQRQSADDLRKSVLDATIQGYTNAADINKTNLGSLYSAYNTANANATPSFTYPGVQTDSTPNTMAQLAAYRAANAAKTGADTASDTTASTGQTTAAAKNAASNVVDSNASGTQLSAAGKSLADVITSGGKLYQQLFGTGTTKKDTSSDTFGSGTNQAGGLY